ncbi:MAG: hypothetical protein SOV61_05500 [Lachnospiraceae bacterium]|nr:hypothetical protein [Lachnospiraceae bacterium]
MKAINGQVFNTSLGKEIVGLIFHVLIDAITLVLCFLVMKRTPRSMGFVKEGAVKDSLIGISAGLAGGLLVWVLCILTGIVRSSPILKIPVLSC